MSLQKGDDPLTVQLPTAAADRPAWLGVGAIAVVGFVIGIAWPRLAGVRLGPSVPEGAPSATVASAPAASGTASSVPALLSAPLPVGSAPEAAPSAAGGAGASGAKVSVARGVVFACKTTTGETKKGAAECGSVPALDGLVVPRLRKLAQCPDAAASSGKLHLNVRADFARGAVSVDLAREKSLASAEALLACAKPALASVSLDGLAHENARYSVAYTVTFAGGAAAPASAPASENAAAPEPATPAAAMPAGDGTAQVEWDVAIVRDAPKTGKVVARLQRGTAVRVGPGKDGWYPVKFGDGFTDDGWVYRAAIGK